MRSFYLIMAVIGTVGPWLFFGSYMAANGPSLTSFVGAMFANGAASGAATDLIVSSLVFWAWSFGDAQRKSIGNWWIVIPATLLIGLSLALPLYLYMREGAPKRVTA